MGDPRNQVHHIRHAAGAFAALFELAIDLRGHDDLPRVIIEQVPDNADDFTVIYDVALADEHGTIGTNSRGIERGPNMNVNVR